MTEEAKETTEAPVAHQTITTGPQGMDHNIILIVIDVMDLQIEIKVLGPEGHLDRVLARVPRVHHEGCKVPKEEEGPHKEVVLDQEDHSSKVGLQVDPADRQEVVKVPAPHKDIH